MTLGERIKYHRERLGLTQEDIAKQISTTPQNIYKYEKGIVTNVPLVNIEAMATIFDISPNELTGWNEKKPTPVSESGPISPDRQYLIDSIRAMPDESVRKLRVIVEQVIDERDK